MKYFQWRWREGGYYSYIQLGVYRLAFIGALQDMFSFGFNIALERVHIWEGDGWGDIQTLVHFIDYYGPDFTDTHLIQRNKITWLFINKAIG